MFSSSLDTLYNTQVGLDHVFLDHAWRIARQTMCRTASITFGQKHTGIAFFRESHSLSALILLRACPYAAYSSAFDPDVMLAGIQISVDVNRERPGIPMHAGIHLWRGVQLCACRQLPDAADRAHHSADELHFFLFRDLFLRAGQKRRIIRHILKRCIPRIQLLQQFQYGFAIPVINIQADVHKYALLRQFTDCVQYPIQFSLLRIPVVFTFFVYLFCTVQRDLNISDLPELQFPLDDLLIQQAAVGDQIR